jgi:ankyrin repeat protein
VTKFLNDHPGGAQVMLEVAGQDATVQFDDIRHSGKAKQLIVEKCIFKGKLVGAPENLGRAGAVHSDGVASRKNGGSATTSREQTYGYLGQQLWNAARDGKTSEVVALLSNAEALSFINWEDKSGETPIFTAAYHGQTEVVKELISAGCDINRATGYGQTPIWIAARNGRTESVKELICAGCDINLADKHGCTPIWVAAYRGNTDAVKELISAGSDINLAEEGGATPIYIAAQAGHTGAVKELISAGCDINHAEPEYGETPIFTAVAQGHTDAVMELICAGCDINLANKCWITPLQVAERQGNGSIATLIRNEAKRREEEKARAVESAAAAAAAELAHLKKELYESQVGLEEMEKFKRLHLEKEEAERNIVGKDLPTILEAVQTNLVRKSPQVTRMVGTLKDITTGNFADSAYGFKEFLKVPTGWAEKEECEVPKLEEEVRRLADCAECAKVQVQVLHDMVDEGREDLRGTLELTKEMILVLEDLQFYRRRGNHKDEEASTEKEVKRIRKEIDSINGWYYGRQNASAVAWPESEVTHDWGKYGQPMCVACKKYRLDHSTISADFNYVLYETCSEKQYPNGVRDQGRAGKSIDDFMKMPQSTGTKPEMMKKSEAVSLRFYSSPSFPAVTIPLRDPARTSQHPLAAITYCIFTGIKKQLTLGAEDQKAVAELILYRGFSDLQISSNFQKSGGSEYAPMSTSTDPAVAVGYAVRKSQTDGALLMRIVTKNNLERGILVFSCSPYPPVLVCTFPVS